MTDIVAQLESTAGNPELGARNLARFDECYRLLRGRSYDWSTTAAHLLLRIFGNSHALAERLMAHPEWADLHAADRYAATAKPREVLAREFAAAAEGIDRKDQGEVGRLLRQLKYREMIRIVARDLALETPVSELLVEWSDVADLLIDMAFRSAREHLVDRMGDTCPGAIIALGKLGGRELNMSSDIDVLFIYERDGTTDPAPHEFYVRLANTVTRMLAQVTDEGFVFRVDHDLRPEGAQGSLANSLDAAERYYGYFGQDWERQALIRARPVAGDAQVGASFIDRVRPIVFRRSLSLADLATMRRMKERMANPSPHHATIDIKHDRGGIRTIEFLVQALQLIYGGKLQHLAEQNTFRAVDLLMEDRLIHPTSGKRLKEAYSFLRRAENMIQIVREQQIHHLPRAREERGALARRMGYREAAREAACEALEGDIAHHMQGVQRLFEGMFEADYQRIELIEAIEDNLASCSNDEEAHDSLAWFKNSEMKRLTHLDLAGKLTLPEVLARLTLVAEVVITYARKLAWNTLALRYGVPRDSKGRASSFAIIGMGKLGSSEIDYASDLDLLFVYSAAGMTDGARSIDNQEFFARLARRIISLISVATRYGRAYIVDSELRPSGHAGTLVSPHSAFMNYHLERAEPWERLSMMRARIIDGQPPFADQLRLTLDSLAFEMPPPDGAQTREQMRHLKARIEEERSRDGDGRFDIKYGPGGAFELDAIIQYHQLSNASVHPRLRIQNTFAVLDALRDEGIIADDEHEQLSAALIFYRRLIALIRLLGTHAASVLDTNADHSPTIATHMGFEDVAGLERELLRIRKSMRTVFDALFA